MRKPLEATDNAGESTEGLLKFGRPSFRILHALRKRKPLDCYDLPEYWDLSFSEDTSVEADFLLAAAKKFCDFEVKSLLEPGCGGGRLIVELARRGLHPTGWDLSEPAVAYAQQRLNAESLSGKVSVEDMRTGTVDGAVDMAYCLVNTFRHLLTEQDATQHLKTVAKCLRPGGLYVIGMHLFPPDADEEDSEDWSVTQDDVTVDMLLNVTDCDRSTRQESLHFQMTVRKPGEEPVSFESEYRMRLYSAEDFRSLVESVPEFERLPDVYDFWYDLDEPLTLSDELGDTVFILRRTQV